MGHCALPGIRFSPGFADTFEDERDLYCDGAELGGGRERPLLAGIFPPRLSLRTDAGYASQAQMARFNLLANGFDLEPHGVSNYTSHPVDHRPPLIPTNDTIHEAHFEIGPWQESRHTQLLREAGLRRPSGAVRAAPPSGKPAATLTGRVFYAIDFAPRKAARLTYATDRWMIATLPWAQKGRALTAGAGVRPPALTLDPKLSGLFRVFVGIANGTGIALRFSGDPESSIRRAPLSGRQDMSPAFIPFLNGAHQPREIGYGIVRMDGRSLRIERFPNILGTTILDYIRFEPLRPRARRLWEAGERNRPYIDLSGFVDVPDIFPFTDPDDPDPGPTAPTSGSMRVAGSSACIGGLTGNVRIIPPGRIPRYTRQGAWRILAHRQGLWACVEEG